MLTTVPFDRLGLRRLPWVTLGVVLAWWVAFAYASASGQTPGLAPHEWTTGGFLLHWLFQATGAQLVVSTVLLCITGPVLEEAWGSPFFALFVVGMALYTGGAYVAFPPESARPLVGGAGLLAAALAACMARHLKDGIQYTVVYWHQRWRHAELSLPVYALPAVWFAGEVILELGAQGAGPTRGLSYSGQAAGAALGAILGFGLRHYGLEQTWLRRRPADAPDPVVENARMLLSGGSPEAALRVLQPAVAARPHDAELVAGLCEAAVAAQEPEAARTALLACVTRHLKSGEPAPAARLWSDWAEALGHPAPDLRMTLPLAEALVARGAGIAATRLLRGLLETPARISTGMALRVVEIARPIHAGVAIRAARLALEGGDFPDAKRARLEAIVRELEQRRADRLDPDLDPPVTAPAASDPADRSIEVDFDDDDLHLPPPEIDATPQRESIELPTDWPDEAQEAAPEVAAATRTASPAPEPEPDSRNQLFGSSQDGDLAAPDAVLEPTASPQTAPVGVTPRKPRPGEPATNARRLMPLTPPPESGPAPDDSQVPGASEPRFQDAKCIEVIPQVLQGGRLSLRQGSAAPAWLDLRQVQAVACAGVAGIAARPLVVIDLLLNFREVESTTLRVLRLRSDRFDPARLLSGNVGGLDGFRAVLEALLEQSGATPLPDAQRARGRPFARFERLEAYEREVLGIDR